MKKEGKTYFHSLHSSSGTSVSFVSFLPVPVSALITLQHKRVRSLHPSALRPINSDRINLFPFVMLPLLPPLPGNFSDTASLSTTYSPLLSVFGSSRKVGKGQDVSTCLLLHSLARRRPFGRSIARVQTVRTMFAFLLSLCAMKRIEAKTMNSDEHTTGDAFR